MCIVVYVYPCFCEIKSIAIFGWLYVGVVRNSNSAIHSVTRDTSALYLNIFDRAMTRFNSIAIGVGDLTGSGTRVCGELVNYRMVTPYVLPGIARFRACCIIGQWTTLCQYIMPMTQWHLWPSRKQHIGATERWASLSGGTVGFFATSHGEFLPIFSECQLV